MRAAFLALVALGAALYLLPHAEAAAGHPSTCADVTVQAVPATLGSRYWFVTDATDSSPSTISGCGGAGLPLRERAGVNTESITLRCSEATTGLSPPAAPTSVTVYAQSDNQNSGSPATSPIWSATLASGSCGAGSTATFFCTATGLSGGSPRFGLVRFIVRAVKTGGSSYDVNSDTGGSGAGFTEGSGVFRCQPDATTFDSDNGVSHPATAYVGGNTYRSNLVASQDFQALSLGNLFVFCDAVPNNAGAMTFSSGSLQLSLTIQGTNTAWPTGCTLVQNATITRVSVITSFVPTATVVYATWNSSPCGACGSVINVGGNNVALTRTDTVPLTRILAASSCTVYSVAINRGDTDTFACNWKDANNLNQQAGGAFRAYATSDGYRDESGFSHVDGSFTSGGAATWTGTAKTTAPTSTGLGYHQQLDTFAAGQTGNTAFLYNWGNATGQFDVSATGTFDGINISKTSGGANASSFTIGNDIEFAKAKGLRNASGSFQVGISISCQRSRPDTSSEPAVVMGNSDASGNSPEQQFPVSAPAGTWSMMCTAAWSGNTASYAIRFFHVSTFTGNLQAPVLWNVTLQSNGTARVNMTSCLREYDQLSDTVMRVSPDDVVKLTVEAYNASDDLHDVRLQDRVVMGHEDGGLATCFRSEFYANQSDLVAGAFAYVTMNFTGNPFMSSLAYMQQTTFAGNFSGNFTGNVAGNLSGNFTGNLTVLDAMGSLSVATAWDPYVPAIFWLVLLVVFAWRIAPLPFIVSFMGLGSALMPIPYQGLAFVACILLLGVAIFIHFAALVGIELCRAIVRGVGFVVDEADGRFRLARRKS